MSVGLLLSEDDLTSAMVTLRRVGAPPLRFKGRRLLHVERQLSDGQELRLELWERSIGGYVLSAARPDGAKVVNDSTVVANSSAAIAAAEAWVRSESRTKPRRARTRKVPSLQAAEEYFNTHLQGQAAMTFRAMVGDALASWFR